MSELFQDDLGLRITDDAIGLMFGKLIGEGEYRKVYSMGWSNAWVLKVQRHEVLNRRFFANVMEWTIWCEFKKTKWGKWLAPCHDISDNGLVLIQSRCKPLEDRPIEVPDFFADYKRSNWGMLNGRPVCFDYAGNSLFANAIKGTKLIKPKWHDLK
jgi:hypothetical protein